MFINDKWKPYTIDRDHLPVNYQLYREKGSGKVDQLVVFDSPEAMTRCVNDNCAAGKWSGKEYRELGGGNKTKSNGWTFGSILTNLEQTDESLIKGVVPSEIEGLYDRALNDLFDKKPELRELANNGSTMRRRRIFDETGSDVDIDRVLSGEFINCWQRTQNLKDAGRIIRLYLDIGVSGGNDAMNITRFITLMTAMANIIEMGSMRAEIYIGVASVRDQEATGKVSRSMIAVKVKDASESIDILKMLSLTTPAFFRYYIFMCYRNILNKSERENGGLGYCEFKIADKFKDIMQADVYLSSGDSYNSTQDKVLMQFDELLGSVGITSDFMNENKRYEFQEEGYN